jgi:hypothetical protein
MEGAEDGKAVPMTRTELLHRAVQLGDELIALADRLPGSLAAPHLSLGIEMLRAELAAAEKLSRLRDTASGSHNPER